MKLKKVLTLGLLVALMGVIAACSSSDEEDYAIARVNDEEIMASEYYESVDRMISNYEQQGIDFDSEQGQMMRMQIEEQAYMMLVQQTLLYQVAEEEGFVATEQEIEDEIEAIREGFSSEDDFQNALEMNGFTLDRFREMLHIDLTIENYFDAYIDEVSITQEEIVELYEEYEAQYAEHDQEMPAFEDVEDELENQLRQEAENEQVSVILDALMKESTIEDLREEAA